MSRIPPSLLYLTIYNPTLRPHNFISDNDEDAEEQAHILFYTSKERAVSRDRMLRQVGLAKALVNFSEMFNANDACNSVHSQSRRMIMISPEPDFWIHACVEVAKVPRVPHGKTKGKEKEKPKISDTGKDPSTPTYDYLEGSVHDVALRQDVLRGYERFKLTHGSFTSILSTLGQNGLELQLERFFTPWAWSWNVEASPDFGEYLGAPLHPSFKTLVTILDKFSSGLPNHSSSILISPPHVVPCRKFSAANHSPFLPRHLLSLVPRVVPQSSHDISDHNSDRTVKLKRSAPLPADLSDGKDPPKASDTSQSTFLGIPSQNGGMDVRKWTWPGYLSFGRGSNKKRILEESKTVAALPDEKSDSDQPPLTTEIEVDNSALEDAIPENIPIAASDASQGESVEPSRDELYPQAQPNGVVELRGDRMEATPAFTDAPNDARSLALSSSSSAASPEPSLSETPGPEFSFTTVYLADAGNPLATGQRKVYYTLRNPWMLALVGNDDDDPGLGSSVELQNIAEDAAALFNDIESALDGEIANSADSLPSATKILQPTDSHIIATSPFTLSNPQFRSKSSHLYSAKALQEADSEISEVFSRGQNPQHWHIARRGLGVREDGAVKDGEVYMEVFRKEASLSDVDNVLAGIVRRCE